MTFPLTGLGSTTATQPARERPDLGRDQFLKLLVTQLKFQDPLSPLEPDAFAAQLAQFSTVEQLTKLNDAFTAQQQESAVRTLLDKTTLGASLIGRHILAEGDQFTVAADGTTSIRADIAGNGGKATLVLLDEAGSTVATRELGTIRGGAVNLNVPTGLPAGEYRYRLDVESASGDRVSVKTLTEGVVDGVVFEGGIVWLKIGNRKIQLDKLSEITPETGKN